jgi:hypothetical protein
MFPSRVVLSKGKAKEQIARGAGWRPKERAQMRSIIAAMPWPTPMHMVQSA